MIAVITRAIVTQARVIDMSELFRGWLRQACLDGNCLVFGYDCMKQLARSDIDLYALKYK
jgi:hypothetical protein